MRSRNPKVAWNDREHLEYRFYIGSAALPPLNRIGAMYPDQ
jgi:hypothetical protein